MGATTLPATKEWHQHSVLKSRHLQLIGLGGAIGAGFLLATGAAIHDAGPGLLLAYLFSGAIVYLMMRALGELALAHPSATSFTEYATTYLGPAVGYIAGWSFCLVAVLAGAAEVTATSILLRALHVMLPQWLPAMGALVILYGINIRAVRSFGETEFWIAMIKVTTLAGVMVCGIVLLVSAGSHTGGATEQLAREPPAGLANLWRYGGFLPKGITGVLAALPAVLFAFAGVESLGVAVRETDQPEHTLPRAIRGLFLRIMVIYMGSLAVIMMLHPWNSIDPRESPFVRILLDAGLASAAAIVSVVAVTATLSSCNTALFAGSRMLYSLACLGRAPSALRTLSQRGTPIVAVSVCAAAMLLGAGLNGVIPEKVFGYLLQTVAWNLLAVWATITVTHLSYRRTLASSGRTPRGFLMPGYPYTSWIVLAVIAIVTIALVVQGATRIPLVIEAAWLAALCAAYRLRRT